MENRREGYVEHLGMVEEALGPGEVRVTLPTDDRHQNIVGVVHGSVTMAVLDTAMGHATASTLASGEICGTLEISFQFLEAARPGDLLVAEGRVTRRGRRLAFLEGTCRNGKGLLVARAHGTWFIGTARG